MKNAIPEVKTIHKSKVCPKCKTKDAWVAFRTNRDKLAVRCFNCLHRWIVK